MYSRGKRETRGQHEHQAHTRARSATLRTLIAGLGSRSSWTCALVATAVVARISLAAPEGQAKQPVDQRQRGLVRLAYSDLTALALLVVAEAPTSELSRRVLSVFGACWHAACCCCSAFLPKKNCHSTMKNHKGRM